MATMFRRVPRKVLGGKDVGKVKLYAMAKSKGLMDLREVSELVSSRSSFSPSDVQGILEAMAWSVAFLLRTGHNVKLGDLGYFRVTILSNGAADEEAFDASVIRKARILFTPGTILHETCRDMEFVPFNPETKIVEVEKECDKPHM